MEEIEKEREMIRTTAAKTAQKIVQPRAAEIDATGEFPSDLADALGKQGFFSLLLPEAYGGTDGDIPSFCSVIEEIAKVSGTASLLILAQGMGTLPLWIGGSPSQKERYFGRVAEENGLTALALNESEGGSGIPSIKTNAEMNGNHYLIQGSKSFVTHGSIARLYAVFAMTGPGISVFVVEDGTPGLTFGEREEKIGMRGSVTTEVILAGCRVPYESRLEEGEGWGIAGRTLTLSRPAIGALALGLAHGALDYATNYAKERIQFKKPIASFQAIQFMIAEMATQVEAARSLVYEAASRVDGGLEDAEKFSLIAKLYPSEIAMRVTTDAVQILGGYGYMRDYPVERMMRDAKVMQVYEEANQTERLLLGRRLLSA
jgi:alkylation response protein AidB-like acyl-CoA dehydrogenase